MKGKIRILIKATPITVSIDLYRIQDYTGIGIFIIPQCCGQGFGRGESERREVNYSGKFMKNA